MFGLLDAIFANDLPKVESLLQKKPQRVNDSEAFCQAIGWGRVEIVKLLIQKGAPLNGIDRNGNHPLHMACMSEARELFDLLVQNGSDPAAAEGLAEEAAITGRNDILAYLHRKGFDLNKSGRDGSVPIEAAVKMGNLEAVKFLLSLDVDTSSIDVSKPLKPLKGVFADVVLEQTTMEQIRRLIIEKRSKRTE